MKFFRSMIVASAGVMLFATSVSAAIVSIDGADVRFTYDDSTLYGTGLVSGNTIFFQPAEFRAESLNGGSVSVSEMLDIQVEIITEGYWLENFQLAEIGDYYLSGAGASASATGMFEVSSNTTAFSDSENFTAGPLTVQNHTTEWQTGSAINLADTAGWNTDTDVTLMIDNDLTAETLAIGEQAWTQKKLGGVGISITAVPVPAAVWLFGSGLLAMVGWSRRRAV